MADSNLDIACAAIEAFSRRELDLSLQSFDPDVVWEAAPEMTPDAGTYRGHSGVRQFWEFWHGLFADFELVIDEAEELDDRRVLVLAHARGTGAASGVPLTGRPFAQVMELRDGLIVRVGMHGSRRRALRAEGLR